jgi:hypothetical protein
MLKKREAAQELLDDTDPLKPLLFWVTKITHI